MADKGKTFDLKKEADACILVVALPFFLIFAAMLRMVLEIMSSRTMAKEFTISR